MENPVFMMTSSFGNISALLALCAGNSPVTGEFPSQRPVRRRFDIVFDLRPNKDWKINNREAGDLRRHRAHYGVIVILQIHIHTGIFVIMMDIQLLVEQKSIKLLYVQCNEKGGIPMHKTLDSETPRIHLSQTSEAIGPVIPNAHFTHRTMDDWSSMNYLQMT